jgi:hypothetical protein
MDIESGFIRFLSSFGNLRHVRAPAMDMWGDDGIASGADSVGWGGRGDLDSTYGAGGADNGSDDDLPAAYGYDGVGGGHDLPMDDDAGAAREAPQGGDAAAKRPCPEPTGLPSPVVGIPIAPPTALVVLTEPRALCNWHDVNATAVVKSRGHCATHQIIQMEARRGACRGGRNIAIFRSKFWRQCRFWCRC